MGNLCDWGARKTEPSTEPLHLSRLLVAILICGRPAAPAADIGFCRHTAVKSGINLIDTAPWYGHGKAEEVLGKALKGT